MVIKVGDHSCERTEEYVSGNADTKEGNWKENRLQKEEIQKESGWRLV